MANKKQHVIPYRGRWAIKTEGSNQVRAVLSTKQAAIDFARKMAREEGSSIVVHGTRGQVIQDVQIKSSLKEDRLRAAIRGMMPAGGKVVRLRAFSSPPISRQRVRRTQKSLKGIGVRISLLGEDSEE